MIQAEYMSNLEKRDYVLSIMSLVFVIVIMCYRYFNVMFFSNATSDLKETALAKQY